ncbi:hypothetical protein [Micromonospora sp. KC723]|uniref:hypothetical protein n=1 Tax=Micromonospora sp. KC723 TaxID=2530381 RepID=UPI001051033C|nr:hypothetical protein [Micromonospora sp. KC723]TDB78359.1 hypothetical protein E1165_01510 [Micromonospora sp. KC723]
MSLAEFVHSRAAGEKPDEISAMAIMKRIIESFSEPTRPGQQGVRWKVDAWRRRRLGAVGTDLCCPVSAGWNFPSAALTSGNYRDHRAAVEGVDRVVLRWCSDVRHLTSTIAASSALWHRHHLPSFRTRWLQRADQPKRKALHVDGGLAKQHRL